MPLDAETREEIAGIFERFLRNRASTIRALTIEDLNVNPFLIRLLTAQMGLRDARSIVRWLVAQRLERGTVTSFGDALQKAAKLFSEGTGVEGADLMKTKERRHHHIQVKSGPNSIPKDLGVRISQLLRSAQRRNRGSVALFGMCYGSHEQVSSVVRRYVEEEGGVDWIAGREFWEFISDDPHCVDEIYKIAGEVGRRFRDDQGQTLLQIVEAKTRELEREFVRLYGGRRTRMWRNLLRRNT